MSKVIARGIAQPASKAGSITCLTCKLKHCVGRCCFHKVVTAQPTATSYPGNSRWPAGIETAAGNLFSSPDLPVRCAAKVMRP